MGVLVPLVPEVLREGGAFPKESPLSTESGVMLAVSCDGLRREAS